jgi:plastocyanin
MRLPALAVAAMTAALAGCGEGDEKEDGRSATAPAASNVRVVGRDYSFDPARLVLTGARGKATVMLTLDNKGSLAHNLRVFDGERDLGGTPTFQGGRAERGSVSLGPGRYRMVCTVGNHEELGMVGQIEVRGG